MKKPHLIHPLFSWDVFTLHRSDILKSGKQLEDLLYLRDLKNQFLWNADLETILSSPYDVLILTNKGVKIDWVSDGFEKMTGYTADHVLGKSPKLLQGEGTTKESQKKFRKQLNAGLPFTDTITNYRKNGEEYLCRIEVYPLESMKSLQVSHYLALESEI